MLAGGSERIIGLMIGVDAKKAFDSIDHYYMQGVLEADGFGPKCKNWFKLLSKNLKVNILVNGFTTENIKKQNKKLTLWENSNGDPSRP